MDNYKIEASFEAVNHFSNLGYDVSGLSKESEFLFAKAEDMSVYNYVLEQKGYQELTLPQLRDLVVLHRNDVKDANYLYGQRLVLKLETQDYKIWDLSKLEWVDHVGSQTDLRNGITRIQLSRTKDQGLISGADALIALIDRKNVQGRLEHQTSWIDLHPEREDFLVNSFLTEKNRVGVKCYFRYKPKTVNVEFPSTLNREPSPKTPYFYLRPDWEKGFCQTTWEGLPIDKKRFENGIWLLEKDAVSAVAVLRGIRG